jgi:hypothetical protein
MIYLSDEKNTLPHISLDEKTTTIVIKGRSTSSSAEKVFEGVIEQMKEFLIKNFKDLTLEIDLEFFNTPTSKKLLDLFRLIKNISKTNGHKMTVKWYFEKGDDDMLDSGEDYESILEVPFKFIEKMPEH